MEKEKKKKKKNDELTITLNDITFNVRPVFVLVETGQTKRDRVRKKNVNECNQMAQEEKKSIRLYASVCTHQTNCRLYLIHGRCISFA